MSAARRPARRGRVAGLRALAGLVAGALGLAAASARAAGAGPCAIVDALTELGEPERAALRAMCESGAVPAEEPLIAGLFRLVSQPAHRAAALAPILAARAGALRFAVARPGADAPDLAAAQRRIAALSARLAAPPPTGRRAPPDACAGLRRGIDAYVADVAAGEPAGTPFVADDPELRRCLGDDGGPAGVRLIAWRADTLASALVVAATPGFAFATWLGPADAVVSDGRRFFVAAVPAAAAVAVIAQVRNAELPAAWRGLVALDQTVWDAPPPMTCLSLDVALPDDGALFVDGAAVPHEGGRLARTFAVTREAHQIVVVACEAGGCFTRYQDTLAQERLGKRVHECEGVRLDLRRRARKTVAILGATQGEACRNAPLRADNLRMSAAEYLERGRPRERHDFRDLAAFAAVTDALVALRGRLNPQGAAGGADTGADGVALIGSAAHEAWRQGIDVLLSFELQCAQRGGEWGYTLEATRINLSSAFSRGALGGAGFDLTSFVETEGEEIDGPNHFAAALARVIDRSLGVAYLRVLAGRVAAPYRRGPALRIARFAGADCAGERPGAAACARRQILVTARRVASGDRPAVCALLAEADLRPPELVREAEALYAAQASRELALPLERDPSARADALARVDRARLSTPRPGWYVVLARWAHEARASDAICVEMIASSGEVWADAAASSGSLYLGSREPPEQLYLRARVGYTRYVRPTIGVGSFLGYGFVGYLLPDGRPAWVDLESLYMGPLRWSRHQLLVGNLLDLRTRVRALPVDLRLRAAPTLAVGVLRFDGVPAALADFLGGAAGKVHNVDLDLHLHVDLGFSFDVGPVTLGSSVLFALDAVDDGLRRAADEARDNAGVFLGLGASIGGIL